MQYLIDIFLLLRRASLLASSDATMHPALRHQLSVLEITSFSLSPKAGLGTYEAPCDEHLDYPLGTTACVREAYRIAMREAGAVPGSVSPDLLWGLAAMLDELAFHDAERGEAISTQAFDGGAYWPEDPHDGGAA